MELNKLENLEPYRDYEGPMSGFTGEEKKETRKEKKQREKLEKEERKLCAELPKNEDFEVGVRHAVKEIKSVYKYDNNMEIRKKVLGKFSYPGNYVTLQNKAVFDFYVRFIGVIDKNIDYNQNWLEFHKKFEQLEREEVYLKQQKLLFILREKVLLGYKEESKKNWVKEEFYKVLSTYPTHSKIGNLYNNLKHDNEVENNVINFCLAYNEGYAAGYLKPEEIEEEYDRGLREIKEEKLRCEKEYDDAVTRARK